MKIDKEKWPVGTELVVFNIEPSPSYTSDGRVIRKEPVEVNRVKIVEYTGGGRARDSAGVLWAGVSGYSIDPYPARGVEYLYPLDRKSRLYAARPEDWALMRDHKIEEIRRDRVAKVRSRLTAVNVELAKLEAERVKLTEQLTQLGES